MPDTLIDRARKAAEEITKALCPYRALSDNDRCARCPPISMKHCKSMEGNFTAIINRNLADLTLIELAEFVEKREQWLRAEISAGRRLDCEGELGDGQGDCLAALEKEIDAGCRRIEKIMHRYDDDYEPMAFASWRKE